MEEERDGGGYTLDGDRPVEALFQGMGVLSRCERTLFIPYRKGSGDSCKNMRNQHDTGCASTEGELR